MNVAPPQFGGQGMPPGPPEIPGYGGYNNRKKNGFIENFLENTMGMKLTPNKRKSLDNLKGLFIYGLFLLLMLGCGIIFLFRASIFGGSDEAEATTEPTEDVVDVEATLVAMQTTQAMLPQQQPPTPEQGPTLEPLYQDATATAFWKYSQPAKDMSKFRQKVGTIRLDNEFGYCPQTNIGFVASGEPYFLIMDFEKLDPSIDLGQHRQLQIEGMIQPEIECQHQVIKVSNVNYSGLATPAPLDLAIGGPAYTGTFTETNVYTRQPSVYAPDVGYGGVSSGVGIDVAPPPHNSYVADIPFNGPDGKPLPTATPNATTAPPSGSTLYGELTLTGAGCELTNFVLRVNNGDGSLRDYLVIFDGASVPQFTQPVLAIITGQADAACGMDAIRASTISYPGSSAGAAGPKLTAESQSPGSQPVESASHQPEPTHTPTETPRPTKTPSPTRTPQLLTIRGRIDYAANCDKTSYGITATSGRYYLLKVDAARLPPSGENIDVDIAGTLVTNGQGCVYNGIEDLASEFIEVHSVTYSAPTPTFTPTFTPSPTHTPSFTPTPTETPTEEPLPVTEPVTGTVN